MSTPILDRKVIAYRVIKSGEQTTCLDEFNIKAQSLIDEGYQPYGEPIIKQPPGSYYLQAFVKYAADLTP